MPTHLRLHRDEPETTPSEGGAGGECVDGAGSIPVTLRFPTDLARARRRLVAAAVERTPMPGPEDAGMLSAMGVERDVDAGARGDVIGRTYGPGAGHVGDGRSGGDVVSGEELVREIERTLDRMQSRLKRVQREVDDVFKFPGPWEDEGPRAA